MIVCKIYVIINGYICQKQSYLDYSGTFDNGHLCTMVTSWFTVGKESPCQIQGQTLIKKPPNSDHLQSTAKRSLRIFPMSNFTSINSQEGDLMQAK